MAHLLDTAPDLIRVLNQVRVEQGRPPVPHELARTQVSHGFLRSHPLGFPDLDGDALETLRLRLLELYSAQLAIDTALFDGCEELLRALQSRAMPWGIVTNKPGFLTTPLLAALGLDHRAGCVVSGDTLPQTQAPSGSPAAGRVATVASRHSNACMSGMAERDVQSARAAGMPVLVARYGYLGPADDPDSWLPDAHIDAPLQILDWLDGARA